MATGGSAANLMHWHPGLGASLGDVEVPDEGEVIADLVAACDAVVTARA